MRTIQGCGISLVIAESFARIFFRNSINLGLPAIEAKIEAPEGTVLNVDMEKGNIRWDSGEAEFQKYPPFLKKIVDSGGIINYAKEGLIRQK